MLTTATPTIIMVGTDHTLAPLALRERLALDSKGATHLLQTLRTGGAVQEAAVLSTCNRIEIYVASADPESAVALVYRTFADLLAEHATALDDLLIVRKGADAVRHLCAVAAGLESMVVAEGQILGQVRNAIDQARLLGSGGIHLGAVFRSAVACGKRVRTETVIGNADISAGSVLIDLISERQIEWTSQSVLLIGAGRMNSVTATRLRDLGVPEIVVASRTAEAAATLAASVAGQSVPIAAIAAAARRATLIVSATRSPGLMLTATMIGDRSSRPLIVADLAVPRDVDPEAAQLPGVTLIDIDHLSDLRDRHGLADALSTASGMVDEATVEWQAWCRTREAVPMISDLRAHVDKQRDAELARTMAHLDHLSAPDRAEIEEMAHRLVNKMFHHIAVRMKTAAADPELGEQYLEAVRFLFLREDHGGRRREESSQDHTVATQPDPTPVPSGAGQP